MTVGDSTNERPVRSRKSHDSLTTQLRSLHMAGPSRESWCLNVLIAETRTAAEYDDASARKALAKAIKAHQAKAAELADLRAAIDQAQIKLASMQEAIDRTAHVEDAVAEAAADALQRGTAWLAKEKRDELMADHALLQTGFSRLKSRLQVLEAEANGALYPYVLFGTKHR